MTNEARSSKKDRFKIPVAVSLFLINKENNKVLLLRRAGTGWEDGKYGVPAGHIDGGESFVDALIREAKEEIGITLHAQDIRFAHASHTMSNAEYAYMYFVADTWEGTPTNKEPHKCDELRWASITDPPENTIPTIKNALIHYKNNVPYSQEGW